MAAVCMTVALLLLSSGCASEPMGVGRQPAKADPIKTQVEQRIAGFLGMSSTVVPQRQVRAVMLPCWKAGEENQGPSWGTMLNTLPTDCSVVYVLLPDENASRGDNLVPPPETAYRTTLGTVRVNDAGIRQMVQDGVAKVSSALAEANAGIRELLLFLQVRLRYVSVIPVRVGGPAAMEKLTRHLAVAMDYRQNACVAMIARSFVEQHPSWHQQLGEGTAVEGLPSGGTVVMELARHCGYECLNLVPLKGRRHNESAPSPVTDAGGIVYQETDVRRPQIAGVDADQRDLLLKTLNRTEQNLLLDLARRVMYSKIEGSEPPAFPSYSPKLMEKFGCILKFTVGERIYGPLTTMPDQQPLAVSVVVDAAKLAAGKDGHSMTAEELAAGKLEISLLTIPNPLVYNDLQDLYKKLRPGRDGVIVRVGEKQAGFIPVVWTQVKTPQNFIQALMNRLKEKPEALLQEDAELKVFEVLSFADK